MSPSDDDFVKVGARDPLRERAPTLISYGASFPVSPSLGLWKPKLFTLPEAVLRLRSVPN